MPDIEANQALLFHIVGILGFIVYMLAYALLQIGKIDGQGVTYVSLNFLAALLVLISLLNQFNMASMLIQVAWIIISITGFLRIYLSQNKLPKSGVQISREYSQIDDTDHYIINNQRLNRLQQRQVFVRQLNVHMAYQQAQSGGASKIVRVGCFIDRARFFGAGKFVKKGKTGSIHPVSERRCRRTTLQTIRQSAA